MGDIFGQDTKFGGAFKANLATMNFTTDTAGRGGLGLLVQNIRAQYNQQISRIWELGGAPQNTYYVVGRSQGDLTIGRIVGPEAISTDFIEKFSDACQTEKNIIRINPTPGFCNKVTNQPAVSLGRIFKNCLINSVGMTMNAQDMLVQESVSLMYTEQENRNTLTNLNGASTTAQIAAAAAAAATVPA